MGIADAILDLVSSGTTLRENNLKEIDGGVVLESQVSFLSSLLTLPSMRCDDLGVLWVLLERSSGIKFYVLPSLKLLPYLKFQCCIGCSCSKQEVIDPEKRGTGHHPWDSWKIWGPFEGTGPVHGMCLLSVMMYLILLSISLLSSICFMVGCCKHEGK